MPGQAIITVGESQWTVLMATTSAELIAGLSGYTELAPGTGILFDMGSDQSYIGINMDEMLFNLDIVFINSTGGVVGVLHNVGPGEDVAFEAGNGLGARYFMEVNAGEIIDVSVGDSVSISGTTGDGDVQPSFWSALVVAVQAIAVISVTAAATYKEIKGNK